MTEASSARPSGRDNLARHQASQNFEMAQHGGGWMVVAAFIVAVRGTVTQAVLLGLAATISHTAIVWAIALGGLYLGAQWNTEATEPYL